MRLLITFMDVSGWIHRLMSYFEKISGILFFVLWMVAMSGLALVVMIEKASTSFPVSWLVH